MQMKFLDKAAEQFTFDFLGNSFMRTALISTSKLMWKVTTLQSFDFLSKPTHLLCSRQRNSVITLAPCLNESQNSGKILTLEMLVV